MKISTQNKVVMAAIENQQAQPLARLLDNTNDLGIQFEFAVNRKRPGTYRIRLVGETMKGKSQLEKARAYMSACDFLAKHLGPEVKDGPWRYQMSSPAQNANKGDTWVGISHESDQAGICRHSFRWIKQACDSRGINVTLLKNEKIHKQKWLLIEKQV